MPPIVRRNERILGPRYASREGDNGEAYYVSMRDRRTLAKFTGSTLVSEVVLGGRGGQTVFSEGAGVWVPESRVSLVDPTKWVGAYPSIANEDNIVTGAPGSSFATNLFTYSVLSSVDTTTLPGHRVYPITGVNRTRGMTFLQTSFDALAYTWFAKKDTGPYLFAIYSSPTTPSSAPTAGVAHNNNAVYNTATVPFVMPDTMQASDAAWHHYAVVLDVVGGYAKAYRDGVLVSTRLFPGPLSGIAQVGFATDAPNTQNGVGYGFTMYAGVLSAAAVSALAAGRMPDSSGVLV